MSLYADQRFIQVLEANKNAVLSLYKMIQEDSRNFNVGILLQKNIRKREFPNWSKGFKDIPENELNNVPSSTPFSDVVDTTKINKSQGHEAFKLMFYFKDEKIA